MPKIPHHVSQSKVSRQRGLMSDASQHLPQRQAPGKVDGRGYKGGETRRNGRNSGGSAGGDTNVRRGAQGNGKGSAAPGEGGKRGAKGSVASHMGSAGRGGKGALTHVHSNAMSEKPSHSWFESLGADKGGD